MSIKIDWSWDWDYFKAVTIYATMFIMGAVLVLIIWPPHTITGYVLSIIGFTGMVFVVFQVLAPPRGQDWSLP